MSKVTTSLGDFSFLPVEAERPLTETLSWFTDVTPTYDGGESAVSLRQQARQSFDMNYPVRYENTQSVFNTVYGSLVSQWLVPVWGEAQYVGTVAAGATGVAAGGAAADLRVGGLALLWGAGGARAVVALTDVQDASVAFATLAAGVRNAFLVPLRRGRVRDVPKRRTAGYDAGWSVSYDIEDNIDLFDSAPVPDQYLGDDIYYDELLVGDGDSTDSVFTSVDRADYDVGGFSVSTPWNNPRTSRSFNRLTETAQEAWDLRLWLHRRQGKYRRFWQPTFNNDLRLDQTGAVTSVLTVKDDAWSELATNRTHIAVETAAGWLPRAINSAVVVGDQVQLTLSSALGVDASAIKRISYLGLRRLDTDTVKLSWIGNGRCQMSVPTVELSP